MAKTGPPIHLSQGLMQAAESTAKHSHRSTAEQIEHWAELGRSVSTLVNPDTLLAIKTGLEKLNVEHVDSPRIDPDAIFSALNTQRENGALQNSARGSLVYYQSSATHPGWLERVGENHEIAVGQFKNGRFIVMDETGS